MSRRTERVASTIQQELAQIIMRELNDPRLVGMPSITRVKVSPDLSIADVYVTIMGTEGQQNAIEWLSSNGYWQARSLQQPTLGEKIARGARKLAAWIAKAL